MIKQLKPNFAIIPLFALVLNSCSGGDSKPAELVKISSDRTASCDYSYDQGGSAPSILPVSRLRTSYFGKSFDASLLDSIADSSAAETVRFAKLTGVTFYKVANLDVNNIGCLFTDSLPSAPLKVEKEFHAHEKEIQIKNPKVTLEGFYLDADMVIDLTGSMNIGPLIAIKNDSERYTMVHEFMHHVYQLQKEKTGLQSQIDLGNSSDNYSKAVDKYNLNKNIENFKQVISNFKIKSENFLLVQKYYPLEEIANESELNNRYESGKLNYINEYSRLSGDYYIKSSASKAKARFDLMKTDLLELKLNIADSTYSESDKIEMNTELDAINRKMVDVINEITSLQSQAQNRIDRFQARKKKLINGITSIDQQIFLNHECIHSQGIDQLMQNIENKTSKIK